MRRNWLISLALVVAVLGLIRGVTAGALWDPHDISAAELGRRIALNLQGGVHLAIPDADNSLPIRADLGRGELPFSSVALGFRCFGLSEWAGRLPLTLWSLLGLSALYAALRRLWDGRAALYAVLVLATTPLYFLQARVLFGEAVTFATFAMAWSGLAVTCLATDVSRRARVGFGVLAALGLYAGFWCRGPIVSVAVPAVAVGLVGCAAPATTLRRRLASVAVLGLGLVALGLGVEGLLLAGATGDYSVFVGSALSMPTELPTFDVPLGELLHAMFPWGAAAPLALWLFSKPSSEAAPHRAVALAAGLALSLSLAVSAWLSPSLGSCSVPGVCCFAVLVGGALAELETSRGDARLAGLVTAALLIVIGLDLRANPEKAFSPFGLRDATLPEALTSQASLLWVGGGALLAVVCALCTYEQSPETRPSVFQRSEYGRVLTTLQRQWDGNLVFAGLVLEAALLGFLLLSAVSERLVTLPQLDSFGSFSREAVAVAAVLVPLAPLAPLTAMALRDAARLLFDVAPGGLAPSRAQGVLLGFAAVGSWASLGFDPALARQVSPKEPFQRYQQLHRATEPLAVLGQRKEGPRYQGAPNAESLEDVDSASEWLHAGGTQRRFLVLRKADLPELNARQRALDHENLRIVDARSSEILLASSQLLPGERDENPLAALVSSKPGELQHGLHAVLDDKLEVLGWSVRDVRGVLQPFVRAGKAYRFTIYYRVLAPLSGSWQSFVHLDGMQRRFNADHELLDGKYPLRLWRQNDVLADTTEVTLGPNFSPADYRVYFGLFSGDKRLPVTAGPADEDKIVAGTLQVR